MILASCSVIETLCNDTNFKMSSFTKPANINKEYVQIEDIVDIVPKLPCTSSWTNTFYITVFEDLKLVEETNLHKIFELPVFLFREIDKTSKVSTRVELFAFAQLRYIKNL